MYGGDGLVDSTRFFLARNIKDKVALANMHHSLAVCDKRWTWPVVGESEANPPRAAPLFCWTISTKMLGLKTRVFLAAALFQVIGNAVGQQPNVASFGDFMEFDIGFHKACENVAGGANTTWPIVSSFTECTFNLSPTKPTDNFEGMAEICLNRGKYFECWDKLRADALKTCGSDKEAMLPTLYRSTVASLCGSDNAATRIESFKKAFEELKPGDESKCPEETGIHWVENCKDLLTTMNSPDLCARHGAIDKCLQKITCDHIKFATLIRQVYTEGRPHLQCNERRA